MQKHYDKVPTQGSTNPVKSDGLHQQLATIGSKIGDLSQLHTTDKTSLVNALNEVKDNSSTTAEDTTYEDNYGIGADNVQDAVDSVAEAIFTENNEEPNLGAWTKNNSNSSFVDNGGHNIVITSSSSSSCRIGFNISNVGEGKELHISYHMEKTAAKAGSWGIGTSLGASWAEIPVTSGRSVNTSALSQDVEFAFIVPAGTSYIFLGAQQYYDNGEQTVTITNFNAWTVEGVREYVDREVSALRSDLEEEIALSQVALSEYDAVWSTNDSSVIYATESGDDVIVSILSKTGSKRCGIDISGIKVGEQLYLDFTSSKNVALGTAETLGGTYTYYGAYTTSFYFTKTDSSQNYLCIAANSYSAGTTLTLVGFKAYKAVSIVKVDEKVETLMSYSPQPSSYIPIKEDYERYMGISLSQGCAVYGNYIVTGFTYTFKYVKIYNLEAKELVQQVALPEFSNPRYHSNTISFSGTKYDADDVFPLLYICSGYTDTTSVSTSEVYVVRIVGAEGSWTTELIQTITLDFGIVNGWTEWVCDPVDNRAWIIGSGIASYICIDIPEFASSTVTIDSSTTLIDLYSARSSPHGLCKKSSAQGRCFYHGRIYSVSGVPNSEGVDSAFITVNNTIHHCIEAIVPLKNFGLTGEPESCFIWNDDFYVAYSSFIAKIIQN